MDPLGNDRDGWGREANWSSYLFDYWTLPQLKLPFDEYLYATQYLHVLCPFEEISLHTSSPDVFLSSFPLALSKSLTIQPINWLQPINLNSCTSGHFFLLNSLWPCLLPKVLPIVNISLYLVFFRVVLERSCNAPGPFLGAAYKMCRTVSKPSPSLLLLSQSIMGQASWCYRWIRRHCKGSKNHRHLGNFLMYLACALRTSLDLITCTWLPFDNGLLLCTSYFMGDEIITQLWQFKLHDNLMTHCQMFSFHCYNSRPKNCLKGRILVCR